MSYYEKKRSNYTKDFRTTNLTCNDISTWGTAERDYRGISVHTYDTYDVRFRYADGENELEPHHIPDDNGQPLAAIRYVAFPIKRAGRRVGYIVRDAYTEEQNQKYITTGEVKPNCDLTFKPELGEEKDTLYITEGEFDALTLKQLLDALGIIADVVSIVGGTKLAKVNAVHNLDFLNKYKHRITVFDNDCRLPQIESTNVVRGSEATYDVHQILDFNCTFLKLEKNSDVNTMYCTDRQSLINSVGKPLRLLPKFLSADIRDDLFLSAYVPEGIHISFLPELCKAIRGFRTHEFIGVISTYKAGKSTLMMHLYYEMLAKGHKAIGLFLESPKEDTQRSLGFLDINKSYMAIKRGDVTVSLEDDIRCKKFLDKRLIYCNNIDSSDVSEMLQAVKTCIAMGYRYIIIDHLTVICGEGAEAIGKQNTFLFTISEYARMYDVCIIVINQVTTSKAKKDKLKEDARIKGQSIYSMDYSSADSRYGSALAQWAYTLITLNPTFTVADGKLVSTQVRLDASREDNSQVGDKDIITMENGRLVSRNF